MNYEKIGELIKFLCQKNEINILKTLNKDISIEQLEEYISSLEKKHIYNYISRFIFIVSDLDSFINSIQKTTDSRVNQGPQKSRGNNNYISYILSRVDKSFRDSMYNHNRIYVESINNTQDKHNRSIPKSCFSFKNIHINLGKVRWYSTTRSFS